MDTKPKLLSRRDYLRWSVMTAAGSLLAACQPAQPAERSQNSVKLTTAPASAGSNSLPTATGIPANAPTLAAEPPKKQPTEPSGDQAYLAVARGQDPAAITEAALKALGGIERFVKKGFDVIIKPNICTDYYPYEYGATTNPVVVATLVKLALGAGAKRVRVMDSPFGGTAESAYVKSGIADAVKAVGGEMELMNPNKFKMTDIPRGVSLKRWSIYQDVLKCDLLIDVPTVKNHSLCSMTAAQKNLLGVIENRTMIHAKMDQRIPDLVSLIRPGLTVVDAIRTLMSNGPTGGNLDDVKVNNTVFASHDIVAADSYATTLLNLSPKSIGYIPNAAKMGLGLDDLSTVKTVEITVD